MAVEVGVLRSAGVEGERIVPVRHPIVVVVGVPQVFGAVAVGVVVLQVKVNGAVTQGLTGRGRRLPRFGLTQQCCISDAQHFGVRAQETRFVHLLNATAEVHRVERLVNAERQGIRPNATHRRRIVSVEGERTGFEGWRLHGRPVFGEGQRTLKRDHLTVGLPIRSGRSGQHVVQAVTHANFSDLMGPSVGSVTVAGG